MKTILKLAVVCCLLVLPSEAAIAANADANASPISKAMASDKGYADEACVFSL